MSRNLKQDTISEVKVLNEKIHHQPYLKYTINLIKDMNAEIADLEYRLSCSNAERQSCRLQLLSRWEKLPFWKRMFTKVTR